jgi:hypothetical protein
VWTTFSAAILCGIALVGCSDSRKVRPVSTGIQSTPPAGTGVQTTSEEGHFTAWFPADPEHTLPDGDLIHVYYATANGVEFLIRYTPQAALTVSLDERLATTQKFMKSTISTVVSVTMCGFPAKEMSHQYVLDGRRYTSRQRIFYADGAMYQLIVVAQKERGIPEEDAQRFFSEFRLSKS